MITCGVDGDVRFWLDLQDDDPSCQCVGEIATSCLSKNEKIYVGNDSNTLQILSCPELEKAGIVTRFSAAVSALSTIKKSKLIVSGAEDMRIQITNINTNESIELNGHEAPILGLSLDPLEEYVASSSSDGTIRVWNIKEKKQIKSWNVVPKSNSFNTAKSLSIPSFETTKGKFLAYPHGKEVVVVERDSWKELFKLKYSTLKADINICKVSECGNRLAGATLHGEIVVWNMQNEDVIGYIEHPQDSKITSLKWNPANSNEIAFCDSSGQLGGVDVVLPQVTLDNFICETKTNSHKIDDDNDDNDFLNDDNIDNYNDDDDDENVISLNKIKSTINIDDDKLSHSDIGSVRHENTRQVVPEIYTQEPFQPGSTPIHLLSRFMVWNDIGIVRCYINEDGNESTIEVEFHDATLHHSMHMNNYLKHTMASLSSYALVLGCQSMDDTPSKIVVIALQGWGSGNKEWSIDLPDDEEACCVAAGDCFVALATSKRHLRLFTIGGVQREVLSIPGSVVAMNARGNHLLVAYHSGVGIDKDQVMNIMWIQIQGYKLKNQTLALPLSPSEDLMWIGLSDLASPIIMDAIGIVKIYKRDMRLWQVAADTDKQCKGKLDHYFIVSISEIEKCIRCILCKGSHYPSTSPRPTTIEIPLIVPLCEIDSEKTKKEAPLWQIGSNPADESTALLTLIGYFINGNSDYRVVDLCENIASLKIIEYAIKYASKSGKMALSSKLQKIAEDKNSLKDIEVVEDDLFDDDDVEEAKEATEISSNPIILTPIINKPPEADIKPLTMSFKKKNIFAKKSSPMIANKLDGLNSLPEKLEKQEQPKTLPAKSKPKKKNIFSPATNGETFINWLTQNKADLEEEFPELDKTGLNKIAKQRWIESSSNSQKSINQPESETKKRKLSSPDQNSENKIKKTSKKLTDFYCDK